MIIQDGTNSIHVNGGNSSSMYGLRRFTWAKEVTLNSYTNAISFQQTSSPTYSRSLRIWAYIFGGRWSGGAPASPDTENTCQIFMWNITIQNTGTLWLRENWLRTNVGNGVTYSQISVSGAYAYVQSQGLAGNNAMMGYYIEALSDGWDYLTVNYY